MEEATYESIRDTNPIVPDEAREQWIRADQAERNLRQSYDKLAADEELTQEAKANRAKKFLEQHAPSIEAKKEAAKAALVKSAKSKEKASIPVPSGEAITTTDATKLVASQMEGDRLVRQIERAKDASGPFKKSPTELLAQEYKRALEVGGVEGGALVRGCLRASDELGLSRDEWLPRNDRQNELLDEARRLKYFSGLFSAKAPSPPRSLQTQARTKVGERQIKPQLVERDVEYGATSGGANRKRAWK